MSQFNLLDLLDQNNLPLKNRVNPQGYYQPSAAASGMAKQSRADGPGQPSAAASGMAEQSRADGPGQPAPEKPGPVTLIPSEPLAEGEQYRFHFDMSRCVGCQCCVVACNEQNNNPAEVNWRRVGDIEGGIYPNTKRYHLSMACNHCLDPSCLEGCPTDAYVKLSNGVVKHQAEECIGCGYCSWNCPYGVPQFNPERRIVTKCDMCHSRLKDGALPACIAACPESAIQIEKVNVEAWRRDHAQADAPGVPDSNMTISTTRITLPADMPPEVLRGNRHRVEPEHAHASLIFMTVLTQLAVGGFLTLWAFDFFSRWAGFLKPLRDFMPYGALGMLLVTGLALFAAVFHLGRPLHAYKALRMWKRSWLSREVLLFALFSKAGGAYALLELARHFFDLKVSGALMFALGGLVSAFGLAGVYASAKIYLVPARPAWNTVRTPLRFFLTGFILGPLFALAVFSVYLALSSFGADQPALRGPFFAFLAVSSAAGFLQMLVLLSRLFSLKWTESDELYGSSFLLIHRFKKLFLARLAFLALGSFLFPFILISLLRAGLLQSEGLLALTLLSFFFSTAGEFMGRYLFFVTVVPKNIPGSFFTAQKGGPA